VHRGSGENGENSQQEKAAMATSTRKPRRPIDAPAAEAQAHREPDDAVDYEALAQFRFELRKFQAFSTAAALQAGLTPQQHQALLTIRGFSTRDPLSIGDLADFLLIQPHTAVGLVDRMTKLELISRSIDAADGRRVLLKLTREGERRLRKLSKIHQDELAAIGPALAGIVETFRGR
jgi:DNA-binding MarR family transcriptional regulator